jgi:hypothetical protein
MATTTKEITVGLKMMARAKPWKRNVLFRSNAIANEMATVTTVEITM